MKLRNQYFLLRHGEATSNLEPRFHSSYPEQLPLSVLTNKGKKDIEKVGKILKKIGIDYIYSSDLTRTKQTALIIKKITKAPVFFLKELRELKIGIFEGSHPDVYISYFRNPLERFRKKPPRGENLFDCQKRMVKALKKIEALYQNKKILIIGHGDPLWLLEGAVKKLSPSQLIKIYKNRLQPGEFKKLN